MMQKNRRIPSFFFSSVLCGREMAMHARNAPATQHEEKAANKEKKNNGVGACVGR